MVIAIIIIVIVGLWFWSGSKDAEKEYKEKCQIDNLQPLINSLRAIDPNGISGRISINCVYILFKKNEKMSKSITIETLPPYINITLGMNNGRNSSPSKRFQFNVIHNPENMSITTKIKKGFIQFENEILEQNPEFWLEKNVKTK